MTRSVCFRGWEFTAILFVLAILTATLTTIPATTHAVNRHQTSDPGAGGGLYITPRHGDDDQPTIVNPPARRTTVEMSDPDAQGGGTGGSVRYANLNPLRRIFAQSRDLLRRLVVFVP